MRGIVGTAGHIDHGKTALVGALTGEDTDRLPEERRRGISIDLGFTHLETRHGRLGVIDVPGHEDFIRNMLAGATGIDVLLLVVAADEGVMPQTREHVAIAELLGVHQAVVALSKADLVDDDWLGLVHDDLAEFLAGTPFAGAPVIPTSADDGTGVDDVRRAIEEVFTGTRGRPDDLFRMPVDRTFTVRGTGTVVTGTVWSGRLGTDATVRLLPGDTDARVRGLQVHGGEVEVVEAGQRAAVALAGVDRDEVERGMNLVRGEGWKPSSMITASIRMLSGNRWRLEPWQRVRVHLGTAEAMARSVLLDRETLEPGQQGLVQLRLETPVVARAQDRLVVRSYSPVTTIGGGVVIEPRAPKQNQLVPGELERFAALMDADSGRRVIAVLKEADWKGLDAETLPVTTGVPPGEVQAALDDNGAVEIGGRVFGPGAVARVRDAILDAVDQHHETTPLAPGIDPEALRRQAAPSAAEVVLEQALERLIQEDALTMARGTVARSDFAPVLTPEQAALKERIAEAVAEDGLAGPRLDELAERLGSPPEVEELVALLQAEGALVRLEHDLYLDAGAVERGIDQVRAALQGRSGLSPGDFREVLGVTRKHLIPLLEHLDRRGVTERAPEGRRIAD